MKTIIIACIAALASGEAVSQSIGLEPDTRIKSFCSSPATKEALQHALHKMQPRVDQFTDYFADTSNATWVFTDHLALRKDGFVLKCEAIAKVSFPPNPEVDEKTKAEMIRQKIESFDADATLAYDVVISENENVFVKVTNMQFSNGSGQALIANVIAGTDGRSPQERANDGMRGIMQEYNRLNPNTNEHFDSALGARNSFGSRGGGR